MSVAPPPCVRRSRVLFLFLLTPPRRSTPVGLQYERFYIPDAVRILDAIVETVAAGVAGGGWSRL